MSPRPTAVALACFALLSATGCGEDAATTTPPTVATATVAAAPTADPPPVVTLARPTVRTTPPRPVTPARSFPATLRVLATDLDEAIDDAERTGSSAAVARVARRIDAAVRREADAGRPVPAGAAALAVAAQTAVSAVESPLLLDEARRQVAAARSSIGG